MIQNEQNYECGYCPRVEGYDFPVEEGTGFISLRELAEHVLSAHPDDAEMGSTEALVEDNLADAELFIEDVITPTIEEMRGRKADENPFGLYWNGQIDKVVTRLENARAKLRYRIRDERNELNREYFRDLADKYVDHWVAEAPDERSIHVGLCSALAMAYEAEQELGYQMDSKWMCYDYLAEALPEEHPDYEAGGTA